MNYVNWWLQQHPQYMAFSVESLERKVTYTGEAEGAAVLTGLSSDPGQGVIIAARDYDRQFSAHLVSLMTSSSHNFMFMFQLDWAAFAVMTLPSLGIPFLLWWSSKSKYEAISAKKD